jgi:hypothetical protein
MPDDPPGGIVNGSVGPDRLKPVPANDIWVMLRFAVPGLLMVSAWVLVKPRVTLPKLMLLGITEICGCTPLPLSKMVVGELVALLIILRLPVAVPVIAGAKPTGSEKV